MAEVDLAPALRRILDVRRETPGSRAVLVALSGIDASGKGHVSAQLAAALSDAGLRVALIGADHWLNLPHVRFGGPDPARRFYEHALRIDEMLADLVLPLRSVRTWAVDVDTATEQSRDFERRRFAFANVDLVLAEGVFLLKQRYRHLYDLGAWIECSRSTALRRAVARAQEGLDADATTEAYRSIYFPAQDIHQERDRPREGADLVIENDEVGEG